MVQSWFQFHLDLNLLFSSWFNVRHIYDKLNGLPSLSRKTFIFSSCIASTRTFYKRYVKYVYINIPIFHILFVYIVYICNMVCRTISEKM